MRKIKGQWTAKWESPSRNGLDALSQVFGAEWGRRWSWRGFTRGNTRHDMLPQRVAASILGLGLSRGALPAAMLLLTSVSVLYRLWRQHKQDVGAKICSLAWRWELIWSREAEVALLEQMRKYRHLWDPQDHLYKKQNIRKQAFQKYIFHNNLIIAINLTTGDSNQKGPMRQV